ncbi:hypothetical protein BDV10DRAFT_141651 [Aspergillus recurvatus]
MRRQATISTPADALDIVPDKGSLLSIALALFGEGSLISSSRARHKSAYAATAPSFTQTLTDYHIFNACIDTVPLALLRGGSCSLTRTAARTGDTRSLNGSGPSGGQPGICRGYSQRRISGKQGVNATSHFEDVQSDVERELSYGLRSEDSAILLAGIIVVSILLGSMFWLYLDWVSILRGLYAGRGRLTPWLSCAWLLLSTRRWR